MRGFPLEVADLEREGCWEGGTAVCASVCVQVNTLYLWVLREIRAYEDSMMIRSGWYFSRLRVSAEGKPVWTVEDSGGT